MKMEKNNKGLAFINKYAETDRHPKYKGPCKVNNENYEVAVWISTSSKTGDKYLSFEFTTEEEAEKYKNKQQQEEVVDKKEEVVDNNIPEDELPF